MFVSTEECTETDGETVKCCHSIRQISIAMLLDILKLVQHRKIDQEEMQDYLHGGLTASIATSKRNVSRIENIGGH